jgi:CRISPR-associated endonuclease/helicase Cas3
VIYTEPAPLDALIQRFGRVNRKREKGLSDCFVFADANDADSFIYSNRALVEDTLGALRNIQAKGGVLKESELPGIMDRIYSKWPPTDLEVYKHHLNLLDNHLSNILQPFSADPNREEDFYRQFDGVSVIPQVLEHEYRLRLNSHQFIEAEALAVSLRAGTFMKEKSRGFVHKQEHVLQQSSERSAKRSSQLNTISFYTIQRPYSNSLGLQLSDDVARDDLEGQSSYDATSCMIN